MKTLCRVRLVQFYLYERLDLQIGDVCGFVGPNGSGKSSLLDAIQIAMFGANTRATAFNAQADESSSNTRTVRSYCLGQYGDTEQERVRDHATTYITLIWKDNQTNEPVSMGVCIATNADRSGHEVLGRYLLRGIELSMSDHLSTVAGKAEPREWSSFRTMVQSRAQVMGDDPLFNDSDRFVRAALIALRGQTGVMSPETFMRSFRFALRLRFEQPVDQLIRKQVLEARPTQIKKFREVTESFRRLSNLVVDVRKKVEEARALQERFNKVESEHVKHICWHALAADAQQALKLEQRDLATQALIESQEAVDACNVEVESTTVLKLLNAQRLDQVVTLRQSHSADQKSRDLNRLLDDKRHTVERKLAEIRRTISLLRTTLRDAAGRANLSAKVAQLSAAADALDPWIAHRDVGSREALLRDLSGATLVVSQAVAALFSEHLQATNTLMAKEHALEEAQDNLKRVQAGRAPLDGTVTRLLMALRQGGITVTPVCDLIRVTAPEWQGVIEGYLGAMNTQALLVAPHQEKAAFEIYRALSGSAIVVGPKIVMSSRHQQRRAPATGSVAELIIGDDPAAVNFLRSKFADTRRAETSAECLANHHALTRDGMLVNGGEIERKRVLTLDQCRLGALQTQHREAIERDVESIRHEVSQLRRLIAEMTELSTRLNVFAGKDETLRQFEALYDERAAALDAIGELEQQLRSLSDGEYQTLVEEEDTLKQQISALDVRLQNATRALGAAEQAQTQQRERLKVVGRELESAIAKAEHARAAEDYSADFASARWDTLLNVHAARYDSMYAAALKEADACSRRFSEAHHHGATQLGQFLFAHNEQVAQSIVTDWRQSKLWIETRIAQLNDTTLAEYEREMQIAYETSKATFQNDVALALHENLQWLKMTIDRLNDILKRSPPFSNGERYQFKRTVRPAHAEMLAFVSDVAMNGPSDDLFSATAQMPSQFRDLMLDKAEPDTRNQASPLDDYREFFDFDVEIYRVDPETGKSRIVGHLSKRLGSGSGGEHRAPLYVIAGAALASAYRIQPGEPTSGPGLIMFDEAFSKMDPSNIIASMRYLQDLGLQVLLASPGENLGILTAFFDRYYDILKDPHRNAVRLQGHDVSQETRDMFREDLTEFHPELVAAHLAGPLIADGTA